MCVPFSLDGAVATSCDPPGGGFPLGGPLSDAPRRGWRGYFARRAGGAAVGRRAPCKGFYREGHALARPFHCIVTESWLNSRDGNFPNLLPCPAKPVSVSSVVKEWIYFYLNCGSFCKLCHLRCVQILLRIEISFEDAWEDDCGISLRNGVLGTGCRVV